MIWLNSYILKYISSLTWHDMTLAVLYIMLKVKYPSNGANFTRRYCCHSYSQSFVNLLLVTPISPKEPFMRVLVVTYFLFTASYIPASVVIHPRGLFYHLWCKSLKWGHADGRVLSHKDFSLVRSNCCYFASYPVKCWISGNLLVTVA